MLARRLVSARGAWLAGGLVGLAACVVPDHYRDSTEGGIGSSAAGGAGGAAGSGTGGTAGVGATAGAGGASGVGGTGGVATGGTAGVATGGTGGVASCTPPFRSCRQLQPCAGSDGTQIIETDDGQLHVWCDQTNDGGGWTKLGESPAGGQGADAMFGDQDLQIDALGEPPGTTTVTALARFERFETVYQDAAGGMMLRLTMPGRKSGFIAVGMRATGLRDILRQLNCAEVQSASAMFGFSVGQRPYRMLAGTCGPEGNTYWLGTDRVADESGATLQGQTTFFSSMEHPGAASSGLDGESHQWGQTGTLWFRECKSPDCTAEPDGTTGSGGSGGSGGAGGGGGSAASGGSGGSAGTGLTTIAPAPQGGGLVVAGGYAAFIDVNQKLQLVGLSARQLTYGGQNMRGIDLRATEGLVAVDQLGNLMRCMPPAPCNATTTVASVTPGTPIWHPMSGGQTVFVVGDEVQRVPLSPTPVVPVYLAPANPTRSAPGVSPVGVAVWLEGPAWRLVRSNPTDTVVVVAPAVPTPKQPTALFPPRLVVALSGSMLWGAYCATTGAVAVPIISGALLSGTSSCNGDVAFGSDGQSLYWCDGLSIMRATLAGGLTDATAICSLSVTDPCSLAVDSGKLYVLAGGNLRSVPVP